MGLAASQGRMLTLTGRKSDIEFKGQMINNDRTILSYQQQELATNFNSALNNRIIEVKADGQTMPLSVGALSVINLKPYYAFDDSAVPSQITDTNGNITQQTLTPERMEEGLRGGYIYLKYINPPKESEKDKKIDWNVNPYIGVQDREKTEDDGRASQEYEARSAALQSKDKRLEMELKNVDSQHKQVETEVDAVKKVIDKNIESTFKTFG